MAASLLLDRSAWDLCLDAAGNIAMASEPYSLEQDVASECRVFLGECYYDTTRGIPYFSEILGQGQPIAVIKEKLAAAAKAVAAAESTTLTGPQKLEQTVAAVAPVVVDYVAKGGLAAVIADAETFARSVVESAVSDFKQTNVGSIAAAILKLLGI